MALTLSQRPSEYTPVWNDQFITYLSNQIAIADFKYVVTVKVNGTTITTYNILQRPDGYLVFNAKEDVQNYIKQWFKQGDFSFGIATNKAITVDVVVKEYYSGALHATDTVTYTAFDACLKDRDFANFNYSDWVSGHTYPFSMFPGSYLETRVLLNTDIWRFFFLGGVTYLNYNLYNSSMTLQGIYTLTLSDSIDQHKLYHVNLGPTVLSAASFSPLEGYYVNVQFMNALDVEVDHYDYQITGICSKYPIYYLYYKKRNGQIDYKIFECRSDNKVAKKTNIVRQSSFQMVSGQYVKNNYDREKFVVSTEVTRSMTLNSDWITDVQSQLMDELFDSPIVWLYDGTDYYPVTITDQSYQYKYVVNDKLFNYTVNIDFDNQETRERAI